jgi:hypothetical protein
VYTVLRATNALGPYTTHVSGVTATAPVNTQTNPLPLDIGDYFYGLEVTWPTRP